MQETEVLNNVADTITDKAITITVDIIKPKWWHRKKQKVFKITPLTLGSLIKISKSLIDIDLKLFDQSNLLESNYNLIEKHAGKMAYIIGVAVVNNKADPSKSLIEFFLNNLTAAELLKITSIVLQQMQIADFMHTIISIKGTNVLQQKSVSATSANESGVSL
jgi:hypothetical protein